MGCAVEFDRSSLHTRLGQSFMRTTFRDIRELVLYEQEKALFPATQEVIEKQLQIRKLRKGIDGLDDKYEQIRKDRTVPLIAFRHSNEAMKVRDALDHYFRLQLSIESVDEQLHDARRSKLHEIEELEGKKESKSRRTYVLACTSEDCKGMLSSENINEHGHYICSICDSTTCDKCKMEVNSKDHECDPDVLKTVEYMDSTSKPCPSCAIPIHKISGCFAANTIIPLADGTNMSVSEIEPNHVLIGDDGLERIVLSTTSGIDQLYKVIQSNGCIYEVNTYHTMCFMKSDHKIIQMTVHTYLQLPEVEKKKLFGYKIVDDEPVLSEINILPTRIGTYYGFQISDNQRFVLQDGTVVHNCSQMFCTNCHASFDWNSLRLNNGAVHNPHHAAWLRENRNRPREVGDIPCGRELNMGIIIDLVEKFEEQIEKANLNIKENQDARIAANYLFESTRMGIHHTHVTINSLNRNQHGHHTNQHLRIDLLMNSIDESNFKREIQRRDKSNAKRNDLLHVVMTYRDALIDIVSPFVESRKKKPFAEWMSMVDQIKALEEYVNDCFGRVAAAYNSTSPYQIMDDRSIR